MAFNAVFAHAQNLDVDALKGFYILLKRLQFGSSAACKVFEIKGQEHIFLSPVIIQSNSSHG